MSKKELLATFGLIIVALFWGGSYAVFKGALDIIKPYNLMVVRFTAASILLTLIYLPNLSTIKKKDVLRGIFVGIWMFGSFWLMAVSLLFTTASKQSFMIGTAVLMVPFAAWFFNKIKPDFFDFLGVVLAFIGLSMLTFGGIDGFNIGDLMSIGAAACLCFQMIFTERYCKDTDPIILTIVEFWVTAIIFIVLMLIYEPFQWDAIVGVKWSLLYLIVPSTVLAFVIQNVVLKFLTSTTVAVIMTLETVFGSVFAVLLLGELMSPVMVTGCVIIFCGIIVKETKLRFLRGGGPSGEKPVQE